MDDQFVIYSIVAFFICLLCGWCLCSCCSMQGRDRSSAIGDNISVDGDDCECCYHGDTATTHHDNDCGGGCGDGGCDDAGGDD